MKPANYLFELSVWITGLLLLAMADLRHHHFSLCPLAALGIAWCPGCGLGRSVSAILQGSLSESFHYHWFGFPALGILVVRIVQLSKKTLLSFGIKPQP